MKNTLLITLLMVAGCSQAPRRSTAPPLPPLPPTPRAQSAPQGAATPKALGNYAVAWDYDTTNMAFEVWSTQDMAIWQLYGRVTNSLQATISQTNRTQFFRVRAINPLTGLTSDWNK